MTLEELVKSDDKVQHGSDESGDEGSLFLGYLDACLPRTGAMNEATVRCLTKSQKNRFAMQTSLETSSAIMFSR